MSNPNRKECSYSEKPNSSDTISRRKAFEYFVTLWECIGTIMDRDEWEDVCMTTANEIPSAQPEEVMPHRNYRYLSDYWCECGWHLGKKGEVKYCSECGRKVNWDE